MSTEDGTNGRDTSKTADELSVCVSSANPVSGSSFETQATEGNGESDDDAEPETMEKAALLEGIAGSVRVAKDDVLPKASKFKVNEVTFEFDDEDATLAPDFPPDPRDPTAAFPDAASRPFLNLPVGQNQNDNQPQFHFQYQRPNSINFETGRNSTSPRPPSGGPSLSRNFSVESSGSTNTSKGNNSHKFRSRAMFKPPDGGWGWVVVFASFMINLIADGISFSFGIIFVDLTQYFGESKSKTAWVGSLFLSMPLITGPLASALTDRYGCRRVTICSGFLSCFGFLLGYMAYTLEHLFIAFSIAGAGLALSYVTSIVIVAYYFEKRRSLATGLAVCGTGFGTFVFAPLTIYLLDTYAWRGTLLIMAGFFLNIIVFGALMRDLTESEEAELSDPNSDDFESDTPAISDINDAQQGHYENANFFGNGVQATSDPCKGQTETGLSQNGDAFRAKPRMFSSLVHIPTYLTHRGSNGLPSEVISELSSRRGGYLSQLMQRYPQVLSSWLSSRPQGQDSDHREKKLPLNTSNNAAPRKLVNGTPMSPMSPINGKPLSPKKSVDVSSHGPPLIRSPSRRLQRLGPVHGRLNSLIPFEAGAYYLRNMRLQRGSLTYRSAMLNIRRYRLRASSAPDIYRNSMVTISDSDRTCSFTRDVRDVLADIVDLSIFKSLRYTLFCVSNLLLYACIDIPYVYLPDHAININASDKNAASFLISVIGIVNTFGIVIVGYIGDKTWIEPSTLYSGFIALSGISMGLIPLIHNYTGLAVIAAIYGLTISANYALVSVILVDLISLDKFTNGYGLLLLVQGIASLVGPPIAGLLFDITGNYNITFYVTGLCIFVSGAIVLPMAKSNTCISLDPTLDYVSSRPSSPINEKLNTRFNPSSTLIEGKSAITSASFSETSNQLPLRVTDAKQANHCNGNGNTILTDKLNGCH